MTIENEQLTSMYTIYMKSKNTIDVSEEIVSGIIEGGFKKWNAFTYGADKKPFLVIDINEIEFITVKK